VAFTGVNPPRMTIHRAARPNGAAILLAQGGGYVRIARSGAVAPVLTAAGFTVFDLLYRLPGDGWTAGPDAPLQDAQRAIRLIRAQVGGMGLDPHRIGVMGFSAGGHVAASLATRWSEPTYAVADQADALSARPDFACLSCPVITMAAPYAHAGSRRQLLGETPTPAAVERTSCERRVTADTPPVFLLHAADDPVVPPDNSLMMAQALRGSGVRTELHLFQEGGHGMGMDLPKALPAAGWPDLFGRWAARNGFIDAAA
jgi:acetyl esterase/lipase